MSTTEKHPNDKWVNILSIAIPLAVALLIGIRTKVYLGDWTHNLPAFIGFLNTLTSLVLLSALYFIKNNQVESHKKAMYTAVGLGAVFLVSYISYHISNQSTPYGGEGWMRPLYYFFLISHIVLSIGVVRLVLQALNYAITGRIESHKKIVKWAYPIWLYVSISGVVVYLMIRPYYNW
jgi:putative membrane protein